MIIKDTLSSPNKVIWEEKYTDQVAGLKSFSENISLADTMSDGDWRLICADNRCKLKVFKGQILQTDTIIQFSPVSIVSFYAPDTNNRGIVPYLALAGGPYIFIYKNLKGTFKFLIPNLDVNSGELSVWSDLKENKIDTCQAIQRLQELINEKVDLSTRSYELLSIKEDSLKLKFIEERKHLPIVISNYIVCMTNLKKNNAEDLLTTSQLVVGTECGLVYIIDHTGSKIIAKFKLPHVPSQIISQGTFDFEYRLYISLRNNTILTLKNGELTSTMINLTSKIVGMVKTDKSIIVGTMDCYYHSFNQTGKKNFSIKLPDNILCLEIMELKKPRCFKGTLIALKNLDVRLYNERNLINSFKLTEPLLGMKFGRFGKDEECLVLITESGALIVKTLSKNVGLDSLSYVQPKKNDDDILLNVPKKTKMYLDLMEREKEVAYQMNQTFQSDLARLRHKTLNTYVKMLKIGNAPQNYSTTSKVKLNASLQGLGPNFKINLTIDNSGYDIIYSTDLIIEYEKNVYYFEKNNIQLALLMPGIPIRYSINFRNISENGVAGIIKIIILEKSKTSPLITSTIKVPISELESF